MMAHIFHINTSLTSLREWKSVIASLLLKGFYIIQSSKKRFLLLCKPALNIVAYLKNLTQLQCLFLGQKNQAQQSRTEKKESSRLRNGQSGRLAKNLNLSEH